MLLSRRAFLKTTALSGSAVALSSKNILGRLSRQSDSCFGVNQFIDNNPDAVFIMRTSVDSKTNCEAKKKAGLDFAKSVFVPRSEADGGIPITNKIALKPNISCRQTADPKYTTLGTMGIVTDSFFVEGIIESMKQLGICSSNFYLREVNCASDFEEGGYLSMAKRTGANIRDLSSDVKNLSAEDVQWIDIENGQYFKRLPYLAPINSPDSYLINIAKFKTHSMGMTLCAKNIQGAIAQPYQMHCTLFKDEMNINPDCVVPGAKDNIMANYLRHVEEKIPRWNKPGDTGGLWQELWATRCLDNNSVTKAGLNIIEGIYGRDGNFIVGPGADGLATDYLSNIVIFGKNPFHVDIIGHWLGGHEPGNFGLFHLALERKLSNYLNPESIPLYEWKADGSAVKSKLTDFPRTLLKTGYLTKDYNGQSEDVWHLVNEPFSYPSGVENPGVSQRPESFVLSQNYPNPFNPSTSIQFSIPKSGNVRMEILDIYGRVIDVLVDGYFSGGQHLTVWNNKNSSSGIYFYRMFFEGYTKTKQMMLLK
ncbi:MAG: DUF362 domain-containing protein [Ignavibacteria bacterium]|jgi:hypothetical protein|nr:DUF362 domain-containing protein [Ignavibacteria bacterium]